MNRDLMIEIVEKVLSQVHDDSFVRIWYNQDGLTRFASSQIHQNVEKKDLVITLLLKRGKKETTVTTNRIDDEGIKDLVEQGQTILDLVPEGEVEVPLVEEPKEMSGEERDELLRDKFGIRERALSIKEGVESLDSHSTAFGSLSLNKRDLVIGNTKGMRRYMALDTVSFSTVVTNGKGTGFYEIETQSSHEMDILQGFSRAQEKAIRGNNLITLKPGKYTVILEPLAVSDLLSYMAYVGFSGRSIQQGRSFLTNKRGTQIFHQDISIYDDFKGEGTYRIPFDLEGVPKKKVTFIEGGVAKDVVYDLRSAVIDGVSSTGHSVGDSELGGFPTNLYLKAGQKDLQEMICETEYGILITRFNYMNVVNPRQIVLTALTRDGTFLIEDGELKGGIRDLRFTESMFKAFKEIQSIGKTLHKTPHFFGVNHVPALKIKNFTFTGICEE